MQFYSYLLLTLGLCIIQSQLHAQTLNLGADVQLCANTYTLDAGVGAASYIWNTGATTRQITVNTSGNYAVTVDYGGTTQTDNINVVLNSTLSLITPTVSFCAGTHTVPVATNILPSTDYFWYRNNTNQLPFHVGTSYSNNFSIDTTYYVQARQLRDSFVVGYTNFPTGTNSSYRTVASIGTDVRGIVFDVTENMLLVSVDVPVQGGNINANIQIRNSANVILYSTPISLVAGNNTVHLNYEIPIGTAYRMVLANVTGTGMLHMAGQPSSVSYPRLDNGLRFTQGFITGVASTNFHCYFYNMKISKNYCQTPFQTLNIEAKPIPTIALLNSYTSCSGAVILDASYAGADYIWSTGESTSSITVSNSSIVSVTVSKSGCSIIKDNINLAIAPSLSIDRADTAVCGGTHTLSIHNAVNNVSYYWFDNAQALAPLHRGVNYTRAYTNDITYYLQAQYLRDSFMVGYTSYPTGTNSIFRPISSYINDTRGMAFDITEARKLISVEIPVEVANINAVLQIRNSSNTVLYSKPVNLLVGNNIIELNYELPVGTSYRMVLTSLSGTGSLHVAGQPSSITYPRVDNGMRFIGGVISGNPTVNFHCFFYNLKVSKNYCTSPLQAFNVSSKPLPTINLDTVVTACADNVNIDITAANQTYIWSTGQTTSTINITNSQQISVTATLNACSLIANSNVLLGGPINVQRPDTSFCRTAASIELQNPTIGASYLWYNTAVSNSEPFQNGIEVASNYSATTNYLIEGFRGLDTVLVGYRSLITGGTSAYIPVANISANDARGIVFTVANATQFHSIDIPVENGNVTAVLQLRNAANTILYTQNLNLTAGNNTVNINYTLIPGITYRLALASVSGTGALHIGTRPNISYPRLEQGVNFTGALYNNVVTTNYHCYFYNMKVSKHNCTTPRLPFEVDVLPTPLGVLPNDTLLCARTNYTIDAQNTGANYLWSTGESTQTINVSQTGKYIVQMSIGQCTDIDSIQVYLLDTVQNFQTPNPTFCAGEQTISINGPSTTNYIWMSAATGGNIIGIGQNLTSNFTATQTLYVEAQNTLFNTYAGLADNTMINGMNSGFINITDNNRGFLFTAHQAAILKTVKVYVDGFLHGTVELRTRAGAILSNKVVSLSTGMQVLELNFAIPSSGEYILVLTNITGGGRLFSDHPDGTAIYPLNSQLITITNSVVNGNVVTSGNNRHLYSYFYDWNIVKLACPTSRYSSEITVLPTPIIPLPSDTVFCATSAMVSAYNSNNTNATYSWSTGATTADLSTTVGGIFTVTATIGQCEKIHNIGIALATPPTQILAPNDTTICGGQLNLIARGNGFAQAWYTSATSNMPIAVSDTLSAFFNRDSTVWVESVNFISKTNTLGLIAPTLGTGSYLNNTNLSVQAGLDFDVLTPIRLDQVSLYVSEGATDAKVILYDMYGLVLQSQWIHLPNVGENIVDLNWILLPANSYQIVLDSISGGKIYTQNATFPFLYNELRIQRGVPSTTSARYSFFYKWKIANLACATQRMPVNITVPPYPVVNMPATLSACNSSSSINIPIQTASTSNYTYAWSTGATTDNIDVIQTGYYEVTVSNNGICNIIKDVYVQFLQSPSNVQVQDLDFCASGEFSLLQSIPNEIYQFYSNDVNQTFLHLNAPYTTFIQDDTSFLVSAAARATTRVGLQSSMNANDINNYAAYNIPNSFNVHAWVVFDSVAVYAQSAPASFDLIITDNNNQEVYRQRHTIRTAKQKVFIPINKTLAPGNNYELQFANFNTAFLVDYSAFYPMQTSNAEVVLTGTNLLGITYPCFFDWHFSYGDINCIAQNIDVLDISVKFPAILPDTTVFVCNDYIVDLANSLATSYEWSTGATTSYVNIPNAGLYTVTISDGIACTVIDSVTIEKPIALTLPNLVNCGDTLRSNYNSLVNTTYNWSTGAFLPYIVLNNNLGTYALTVTTPQGCYLTASTVINAIEEVPFFDLGNTRVLCEGHQLQMPHIGSGYTYAWSTGETTDYATIANSGLYAVTVTTALGCSRTDDVIINSLLPPVAGLSVFYNQSREVGLSNLSSNYNYHFYDYGDGSPYTTASFHTYDVDSCYTIKIVAHNSCGADTAAIRVPIGNADCTVGIDETLSQDNAINFVILPNPNYGQFTMQWNTAIPANSVMMIYDATGRILYKEFIPELTETWNLSLQTQLASGMYFVHWQYANHSQVQRLIIMR